MGASTITPHIHSNRTTNYDVGSAHKIASTKTPHQQSGQLLHPLCLQVPDVWWWPWPAVTGVADCLSCPIRNPGGLTCLQLSEQRTVGEFMHWTSRPLIPTGEDKTCKSHLATKAPHLSLPALCLIWKCRFVEKAVKAKTFFFFWPKTSAGMNIASSRRTTFLLCMFQLLLSRKCFENKLRIALLEIYGIKVCVVLASRRQVRETEEKTRNMFCMCVRVRIYLCVNVFVSCNSSTRSLVFSLVHEVRVRWPWHPQPFSCVPLSLS